ncbi:MAG: site-specific DNA-methyltransferase [Acidimicrobiia bacterium]|nr:site-specific DNA-methyltransferase [Acidimicrobiia bacterium]MCY4457585.1 DNA methyltransferase [Acidimicrobiaceae bacterium]
MIEEVYEGDCREVLRRVPDVAIDLAYMDPPFYSQKVHKSQTRNGDSEFVFSDVWLSEQIYSDFIMECLVLVREKIKFTGSLFFHCDKSASHVIRTALDDVFGKDNFRAEIIWHYRRWSNAKRGLLNAHQTIFFYSKSSDYKFNEIYEDYSLSTNIDQLMQKRARDSRNKTIYARQSDGQVVLSGPKKGVPLSDVWQIPFLNPKAKERVGYPTQKPIELLKRIVSLVTDPGDIVLDPFCGSGTTLIAAKLLARGAIGIDISSEAVQLTRQRMQEPIVTDSKLMRMGKDAYDQHDGFAARHLAFFDYVPVQRNKGIDGILKEQIHGLPIYLRVQRNSETQHDAAVALAAATKDKGKGLLVVVATRDDLLGQPDYDDVVFLPSFELVRQYGLTAS